MLTVTTAGFTETAHNLQATPNAVRWATYKAVNEMTELERAASIRLAESTLTIRNGWLKQGGKMGFNIPRFARYSDPEPFARMGSRAPWLPLLEEGGTRKTTNGQALTVPVLGGARITPRSPIRARLKPRALLSAYSRYGTGKRKAKSRTDARHPFVMMSKKGWVIASRISAKSRTDLKIWYGMERNVTVKPMFPFALNAKRVFESGWPAAYQRWLRQAMADRMKRAAAR